MTIQCRFETYALQIGGTSYKCVIDDSKIPKNVENLVFSGKHFPGRTNNDVNCIQFRGCLFQNFPKGLTKIFPKLRAVDISNSNLDGINRAELDEYKKLKFFICTDCQLKFLSGGLFEGFNNLEWISFRNNELEFIESNILDGLEKLEFVDFRGNPKYDKFFSIFGSHCPNATLKEVKNQLLKVEIHMLRVENIKKSQHLSDLKEQVEELKLSFQKGLIGDIRSYIQENSTKDFIIKIDDREFPVHKFVLAARSPTLASIFKNNPGANELKLVDISVEIFETVLKFLYTDKLPNSEEDEASILGIFAASGQLKIIELLNFAALKISGKINRENAIKILKLSNKYGHDDLRDKAFNELRKKYPEIPFKDEWKFDVEKIIRAVEAFNRKEEEVMKFQKDFESLFTCD